MSQDFEELLASLNESGVRYLKLGIAPVRIDVLSHFATMTFAEAWRARVDARFGGVEAHYLGREHLIAEKTHFDRDQDRADVAALRAAAGARNRRQAPSKRKKGG